MELKYYQATYRGEPNYARSFRSNVLALFQGRSFHIYSWEMCNELPGNKYYKR